MKVRIGKTGFKISFKNEKIRIAMPDIQRVPVESQYTFYEGDYEVTPKAFTAQELETQDKILTENVRVKEIPYFETSNIYGDTVYIGNQI